MRNGLKRLEKVFSRLPYSVRVIVVIALMCAIIAWVGGPGPVPDWRVVAADTAILAGLHMFMCIAFSSSQNKAHWGTGLGTMVIATGRPIGLLLAQWAGMVFGNEIGTAANALATFAHTIVVGFLVSYLLTKLPPLPPKRRRNQSPAPFCPVI